MFPRPQAGAFPEPEAAGVDDDRGRGVDCSDVGSSECEVAVSFLGNRADLQVILAHDEVPDLMGETTDEQLPEEDPWVGMLGAQEEVKHLGEELRKGRWSPRPGRSRSWPARSAWVRVNLHKRQALMVSYMSDEGGGTKVLVTSLATSR